MCVLSGLLHPLLTRPSLALIPCSHVWLSPVLHLEHSRKQHKINPGFHLQPDNSVNTAEPKQTIAIGRQ